MATNTDTEVKVRIDVIPALHTALDKGEREAAKAGARFVTYGAILRAEAAKLDLNPDDASLALRQSYVFASKGYACTLVKLGTAKNAKIQVEIPENSPYTVAEVEKELERLKFDVSKVMKLAFPKDEDASKQLDLAYEHNKGIADYRKRVGVNDLLEIARGNVTLEHLLNPPVTNAPSGQGGTATSDQGGDTNAGTTDSGTTDSGTDTGGTTTTEGAATTTTTGGTLSPTDRFQAALEACKMDGLTYPDAQNILNNVYGRTK